MTLPPPFRLRHMGRIDSSNDEARRLARAGEVHGLVVTAVEQTAGRGRRGRVWHSPPGNLHCSLLLDPGDDASVAPQLTFVAALALRDALESLAPNSDFRVKWPNDLLCNGAKIAGMLLEREGRLIILGVGVNIVASPAAALYPATCLARTGSAAIADEVLLAFCGQLGARYDQWRQQGFAAIRRDWLLVASGQGQEVTARLANETVMTGIFAGLATDGALELVDALGVTHRVLAGDIFFTGNGAADATGD
jgi:BirA family biotin operon repressor/biotin-[acetyl-CoA-carboxylase] ligase